MDASSESAAPAWAAMRPRADWPENWPAELHAHVSRAGMAGHSWGRNDCALFTCDWVRLVTGYDPARAFRRRYSTATGSVKALLRYGTGDLVSTFDGLMPPRIAILRARRGDACAAIMADGPALGLVCGSEAAFIGLSGIGLAPLSRCLAVWPVG